MAKAFDWDETPEITEQTAWYFLRGLRTLWSLIALERKRILIAVSVLATVSCMDLAIPLLVRGLIDNLPQIAKEGITSYVFLVIAALFGVRVGALALRRFVQEPIFLRAIIHLENYWPQLAQEKLLALSVGFHERENTGRKIAKVNKGVERLVSILSDLFWQLLPSLLYMCINVPIIIWMDWRLGLLFTLPLIPFVWINLRSYRRFYPHWMAWEEKKEEAVGFFCESILNIRTVQSFVQEEREAQKHGNVRDGMQDLDTWITIRLQRYYFAMESVLGLCFLVTLLAGLYFVYRGWSTVGTVTYLFVTGNATLQGLWGIINVYTRTLRHLVSAERMQMLLDESVDVANTAQGIIPHIDTAVVRFENLTHTYPEKQEPAISNFNLTIEPGEMIAFVGKSGSGKTTLASLLTRVLDPSEGSITVDGYDIRDVDRDWYRKRFAVVPQDVEIFEGTIRYNISLAYPDAPDALLSQAVQAACLSEPFEDSGRFPDGLETAVGERGVRLSGGERQRVGIARAYVALLAGANTLILDEATSSLDSQSENVIQGFIEQLRQKRGVTIVAIAHRLSTIRKADRICVLEGPDTVEIGDHTRLLAKNGLYRRLIELQDLREIRE